MTTTSRRRPSQTYAAMAAAPAAAAFRGSAGDDAVRVSFFFSRARSAHALLHNATCGDSVRTSLSTDAAERSSCQARKTLP